jgi:hypothetical protein
MYLEGEQCTYILMYVACKNSYMWVPAGVVDPNNKLCCKWGHALAG